MHFVSCRETVDTLIQKISNKEAGIYLRYGDGDFNLAQGIYDLLASPTESLQKAMNLTLALRERDVLIAIPHHCKELNTIEDGICPGNHEYPLSYITKFLNILHSNNTIVPEKIYTNIALSYCSSKHPEKVVELHNSIKKFPVLFFGNQIYSDRFLEKLFGSVIARVTTPERDAWFVHDEAMAKFQTLYDEKLKGYDFFVVIMAAGCAGRPFAGELYTKYLQEKKNFFVLDYGSLLDYLYGLNTRAYMDIDPPKREYILSQLN